MPRGRPRLAVKQACERSDDVSSLYVIKGKDQGRRFDLDGQVLQLGRDSSNPVQLHDTEISRRHAEIRCEGGNFALIDLSSSNGTYVNDELVQRHILQNGDRVQIGRTIMLFTGPEPGSSHVLASEVEIIEPGPLASAGSRIVKAISQEEGSRILSPIEDKENPWLARARSNLQIMYRTALAVSHTLDIDQLLQRILELIAEWVECDRGCIMLINQDSDQPEPRATRHRQGLNPGEQIEISRTILNYVIDNRDGVITSDAREDDRWESAGSIVKMGVREAICVPMQGRYGIVGVIYIDTFTPPGRTIQKHATKFTEEHLKMMIAIGHQAALAVEDTSYYSAMVQSEKLAAMGQTIATLSHHIKNILQGIRGGSYLIEEGLKSSETDVVRRGWNIVEKNQEKISNLVMDMLTFSKERQPDVVPANMNQVTADVVELMQARAAEAGVRLESKPDLRMPTLTFDPEMMHRAILNVVTNAIDACAGENDRAVTVATAYVAQKGVIHIIVEDNGEGIDEDDLKKIFSVFESRKGSKGTGLGLPVSQKILREHNGDIHVESTRGEGSKFMLELPAVGPEMTTMSDTLTGDTQG